MADTQSAPGLPELTVLSRVASIPLITSSLAALTAYPATQHARDAAHALAAPLAPYTAPFAARCAPLLTRADGLANAGLDAVESRYPYPFRTPPQDIIADIRGSADHARAVAAKTVDDRLKNPAVAVAQGIDQRFTPLVDYFALAVSRLHPADPAGPSASDSSDSASSSSASTAADDAKYQYQRAYALSLDLKDQLYVYSNDQLAHLQAQSALVQKATQTAHSLSVLAASSAHAVQTRAHALSETMLQELHRVQTATAALPAHLQAALAPLTAALADAQAEIARVRAQDAPVADKAAALGRTVSAKVKPVLEAVARRVDGVRRRASGQPPDAVPDAIPAPAGEK
ncbi:hypothetical protein HETIRDRAFT_453922 [Heterobasidion irregulare TC 32-1]|uniref:Lipid droplet-associated perilipin protein n=1 Tax=Heterobasidion irregulare (strain TC 32-1) TaxID=747525 RepID=W4JW91_HETIT|nr:uncharacterized protein HETIRDRAFT_453922 [Heterobasidion irregulare TC 32-1]ETW77802.1 hypothetical protein HETIRDRAFT_453922 [Heterobasidion irregulare TC 32-1]